MATILIVDDDPSILRLYMALLSHSGHDVIGKAKNGEEAVILYKKFPNKPDVIIMDHRMPLKNGIEASKEILRINEKAKIIFASADNDVETLALSIGVFSFKTKPFFNEKLISNIEKVLIE